jgi:outer membrane protein assembly factor BamB
MITRILCRFGFLLFLGVSALLSANSEDWPGFRGPNYDGSALLQPKIAFDQGGTLAVKWRSRLGPGYSGVSVVAGKAVTMFSNGVNDFAVAFDATKGTELWRSSIGSTYRGHDGSHDGPIATPRIADGRVFCLNASGKLFALDFKSGKELWTFNLAEQVGDRNPFYGFATSPLVAGGILIVQVGADSNRAIAGLDPATGKIKWTLGDDKVSYQSPILMRWKDSYQVVATGDKKLFGIDPVQGKILWEYVYEGDDRAMANQTLVPLPAGEGLLFLKNKIDKTSMVRLKESTEGTFQVETVWTSGVLKGTYSMSVYHNGYLYGYNGQSILMCVDAKTGEMKWRSREPGDGFLLLVNGNLVVQTKAGSLHVGPATPDGWKETAKLDLFDKVAWTNPTFADGAIFSRGQGEIARIEWTSGSAAPIATAELGAAPPGSRFAKSLETIAAATDKKAATDKFVSSISSFPLIEWPDLVHFIYRGEAKDMGIAGDMIGDRREDPMHHVEGTDLYYYSIRLEPDAMINYWFIKNYDQQFSDPRHDRKIKDQYGEYSWMAMPGWKKPEHLKKAPEMRRGRMESRDLKPKAWEGSTIKYDVYLPAGYGRSTTRYPTVYIFGGADAQQSGFIKNSLDNVIGSSVQPVIAVFLSAVDFGTKKPEDYWKELEVSAEIVTNEIVPLMDTGYRTIADSSARASMGAGFDATSAVYVAFKYPGIFGNVAAQSIYMLDEDEAKIRKLIRTYSEQPLRMYLDWGLYDLHATREGWDTRKSIRNFNAFLLERGYKPAGGEVHDSSGWTSWRNRTDRWLMALFPAKTEIYATGRPN